MGGNKNIFVAKLQKDSLRLNSSRQGHDQNPDFETSVLFPLPLISFHWFFFHCFFFFGCPVAHGVPRPWFRSKAQLQPKPQLWQHQNLNPLCQAGDWTCVPGLSRRCHSIAPQQELLHCFVLFLKAKWNELTGAALHYIKVHECEDIFSCPLTVSAHSLAWAQKTISTPQFPLKGWPGQLCLITHSFQGSPTPWTELNRFTLLVYVSHKGNQEERSQGNGCWNLHPEQSSQCPSFPVLESELDILKTPSLFCWFNKVFTHNQTIPDCVTPYFKLLQVNIKTWSHKNLVYHCVLSVSGEKTDGLHRFKRYF